MTVYVLVMWLTAGGVATSPVPYLEQEACEAAAKEFQSMMHGRRATCLAVRRAMP